MTDADVTVTNTATNVSYTAKTNQAGLFTVPYLEDGTYSVAVTKAGFETFTETDVHLDPSATARVAATLRVGSASARVEVTASAVQLQTDSSSVSAGVSAQVIDGIPNITENPFYYTTLQNGVQPRNETSNSQTLNSFGIGVAGRSEFSAIGVNGGRAFENDIQLDGLAVMGDGFDKTFGTVDEEGIQEVRVINNNFTADYGHGQAVMAITSKSGTNQFHGQASYLIRDEALNANTWGNNQQGIRRPAFKVNDFGGALAGPMLQGQALLRLQLSLFEVQSGPDLPGNRTHGVGAGGELQPDLPAKLQWNSGSRSTLQPLQRHAVGQQPLSTSAVSQRHYYPMQIRQRSPSTASIPCPTAHRTTSITPTTSPRPS